MDWLLVTVLGLTLALLAPAIASAATLKVATDGVDESTCLEDACASIEYAMGLAESGDTIKVPQFSAGSQAGTATVTVKVDNESVTSQIGVTDPPPAPDPGPPAPPDDDTPPPTPEQPTPGEVRNQASRALGSPAVTVRPVMGLSTLRVLMPRPGARHRNAKPRIPVVAGARVKIHGGAINRRIRQRLAALGSLRGAHRAHVIQMVRVGRRTVALPRQRIGVGEGRAKPVTLPITNAMRKALRSGRSIVLTLRVAAVDSAGNRRSATKRFRLQGEKPRNRMRKR